MAVSQACNAIKISVFGNIAFCMVPDLKCKFLKSAAAAISLHLSTSSSRNSIPVTDADKFNLFLM